jgi:hypothetical protein
VGIGGAAVKIRSVKANNRKRVFEVRVGATALPFPYSKAEPAPGPDELVVRVAVDEELAREAFGFDLRSGRSGTVHVEQVLEYNQDPSYMRDLLLYKLTLEAQARVAASSLSKREIVRRLGTSAAQLYRLLDQTNYAKSIDKMLNLLRVLDCEVDLVVRARTA